MKTHWFSVLSVAGIVLLTGNAFGNELRWGKPANSAPVPPSVMHIPAVLSPSAISMNNVIETPEIVQVQRVEPVQLPPRLVPPTIVTSDLDSLEMIPQNRPMPSGATLRNEPPIVPIATPIPGRGMATPCNDKIGLKSIREISHDIRPARSDELPEVCVIDRPPYYGRHFGQTCFMWTASALSTRAAYFEDVQLERYGNTIVCPALQPIVSGVKFFATIPILPYKMGVTPPHECVYTLGHRRPGSRAPYMVEPFPISPRGALFQAGAVVGGVAAIP